MSVPSTSQWATLIEDSTVRMKTLLKSNSKNCKAHTSRILETLLFEGILQWLFWTRVWPTRPYSLVLPHQGSFLKLDFRNALKFLSEWETLRRQIASGMAGSSQRRNFLHKNKRSTSNSQKQRILLNRISVQEPEEKWNGARSRRTYEAFMGNHQSQRYPKINKWQSDSVTKDVKAVLVLQGQNDGMIDTGLGSCLGKKTPIQILEERSRAGEKARQAWLATGGAVPQSRSAAEVPCMERQVQPSPAGWIRIIGENDLTVLPLKRDPDV